MAVEIKFKTEEWERDKARHPELAELERAQTETPAPKPASQKAESKIIAPPIYEYDEERFMFRTHEVKNWLLLPLIIFTVVGFGVTIWQVVLNWFWVLIGVCVIGAIGIVVKIHRSREDE